MVNDRSNQLLGELLTEAGLLRIDDLREAANIARNQGLPIGKVLVMSGYISKETLQASVEAQSRIKDGLLDYDIALRALVLVSKNNGQLDNALSELNWHKIDIDISNRLGDLLLGACLISDGDLIVAMEEANRSGLPLGRVLLNLSMISESLLNHALRAQSNIREGRITKEQAVRTLLIAKEGQLPSTKLSAQQPAENLAIADEQKKPEDNPEPAAPIGAFLPGDKFSKNGSEPVENVKANVEANQIVSPYYCKTNEKQTSQFVELKSLSLHHVLRVAGLVETAALEKAILESLEDPEIMTMILRQTNLLEEFVIEAAKECCHLIREGMLKPEQAIIALHHCQRTRNTMRDCLEEFGWLQQPAEMANS